MHTLWGTSGTPYIGNYFVSVIILKKKLKASFFYKKFNWFFDDIYYKIFDILVLTTNMAYIYMDESGDLGFSNKIWSSKYFIITFLIAKNEKDLEIIMKNIRKRAIWKWVKINWTFFHSNKESTNIVKRILDLISRKDIKIVASIINKRELPYNLKNNLHVLYNDIVYKLLELCKNRWFFVVWDLIKFTASRRETKKSLNENFKKYILNQLNNILKIDIQIKAPWFDGWLEIVDAVAFALHRKYEHNDFELYWIIKNKIILEKQIV